MTRTVINAIQKRFGQDVESIESLGGGFYGRVFGVKLKSEPYYVVAKVYLFPELAKKEAVQIKTLTPGASLVMPKIYGVYITDKKDLLYDVLLMEYLDGINAGSYDIKLLSEHDKNTICTEIVDNLISIHSMKNEKGFGELSSERFYQTWQEFYRPKAEKTLEKARMLNRRGQVSDYALLVFERSFERFDKIFNLPITEASLIHGDYNTWNIMLNPERTHAKYLIDPFGCCFADSEYDLYQLDNANGKAFGLLKKYSERATLSENFEVKKRFYRLYSEIGHYHDANVSLEPEFAEQMAKDLDDAM